MKGSHAPVRRRVLRATPAPFVGGAMLLNLLLVGGLALVFLPWAVRTVTAATGKFGALKVTHLLVAGTSLLVLHFLISGVTGRFKLQAFRGPFRLWFAYLCIWGLWMAAWGWLNRAPFLNYLGELCALAIFLAGIAVGTVPANWRVIDRVYPLGLGLLGIPVVLVGMKLVGSLAPDTLKTGLVYTTSAILIPATFFALMPGRLPSLLTRRLASAAFFIYAILQFLFAKRAPLIRVLVVFFLAYWVIPGWTGGQRALKRLAGLLLFGFGVAVVVTLVGGRGVDDIFYRFEKLAAFSEIAVEQTSSDVWEDPRAENETFRIKEVGYFYDGMTSLEVLVGTGLGSFSRSAEVASHWQVDTMRANEIIAGKSMTHVGMFWSFFKGGAPYFLFFHIGIVGALVGLHRVKGDPLKLNAWAFVFTYLLFSMMEGFWMSPGVELTTFLVGASLGALVTRE